MCFLTEPVSTYLFGITDSLVDLCLSGTQIYSRDILVRSVTRLTKLEHLRLNGLSVLNDQALEQVMMSHSNSNEHVFESIRFFQSWAID
jgi:hypothetical protein